MISLQRRNGLDPELIVRTLAEGGMDARAVDHLLRRLERVKREPSFLAIAPAGGSEAAAHMLAAMTKAGQEETQGLDSHTLDRVSQLVGRWYHAK